MKRRPLDPKDARPAGSDRDGTVWVDGRPKAVRTTVSSEAYRKGWERVFGDPVNLTDSGR